MEEIEFTSELDVELVSCWASDEDVIRAMLVSTGVSTDMTDEAAAGRINSLMRNRHGTPFEHNFFTFHISMPIFVFREFHRHRIGWSYNEESGRYKRLAPKFYIPGPERPLRQVDGTKQMDYISERDDALLQGSRILMEFLYKQCYLKYEGMLRDGVVKEVARMVLPVSIYSSMFASCNARSLMAFLSLRRRLSEEEATFPSKPMWEIDQVAMKLEQWFASRMPLTYSAFVENGYVAP